MLQRKKRIYSMAELAINKDPALISDFDANYDEVRYDIILLWFLVSTPVL